MSIMREGKAIRSLKQWMRSVRQLSAEHRASLSETLCTAGAGESLHVALGSCQNLGTLYAPKEELVAAGRLVQGAEATGIAQLQQFTRQVEELRVIWVIPAHAEIQ